MRGSEVQNECRSNDRGSFGLWSPLGRRGVTDVLGDRRAGWSTVRLSTALFAALAILTGTLAVQAQTETAAQVAGYHQNGQAGQPKLRISMKQAVDIALAPKGSTRVQLAQEFINQARDRMRESRAALLPDFEASVVQENETRNLAAFGLQINLPFVGFSLPRLTGPFNSFDARATFSQSIFDLSSIRRYQAARAGVAAAKADSEGSRDQVTADVAEAYIAALRAEASVSAIESNVELAQSLEKLAADQKDAGIGTGLDVTRARVQLANERQRLLVAQNDATETRLQLLRAMNLDLDVQVELSDVLAYTPEETLTTDQATRTALQTRANLKAQLNRQENARLNYSATGLERIPSVIGFADYGNTGIAINNSIPTRTYGFSIRVPVFDGGRRDARRAESLSLLEQERIKTHDLEQQVRLEVRMALDAERSAVEQVNVAEQGLALSEQELAQARRRFEAGITNSIEVVDAQTRLERARDNRIAALYNYNLARINIGAATGLIQQIIK
ncbi:MAG TPA: TolC family protein [Blastocatellia bacterium]|nr:TolC family protein [Blastocatellia bacterium]